MSPRMENIAKPLAISLGSYALWRFIRSHVSPDEITKVPGPGGNHALAGKAQCIVKSLKLRIVFVRAHAGHLWWRTCLEVP